MNIPHEIKKVFSEREEIPLIYIESGSRLWGIASPDSDYDVRGIHLQSKRQQLDWQKYRDVIEVMDGDFDFVSFDLDKMFTLLGKSNPTVFEWVRAHIEYYNAFPHWEVFRDDIIANFNFKALYHHYLSLAHGNYLNMLEDKKFTYKTVFYCIRGLLSADLASQRVIPELLIEKLFEQMPGDSPVLTVARESLDRKRASEEKQEVDSGDKKNILRAVNDYQAELATQVPGVSNSSQKLRDILTGYALAIKEEFYSSLKD